MKKSFLIAALALTALILFFVFRGCRPERENVIALQPVSEKVESVTPSTAAIAQVPVVVNPPKPIKEPAKLTPPKPLPATPSMEPPPVQIFKELIPKNIEIVRVYYERSLTGPESTFQFDINGSGFTKEFERMITVESGSPDVAVKDLALVTPNQIHGTLVVNEKASTNVVFPQILIGGKVVFRAPEPFAVIRPGEVLNLIFIEMGENGRTGRFRVFTNLNEETYPEFSIVPTTPSITVSNMTPSLPFVVEGLLNIGQAEGGVYGLVVKLREKVIWKRDGMIRVVKPNLGQTGLIQRLQTVDGFHRPGDQARFVILGSGFQPQDINLLKVQVPGFENVASSFSFVAPGRLDMVLRVPLSAASTGYQVSIVQESTTLVTQPDAFQVVPKNWLRGVALENPVGPGGSGTVVLAGRDLDFDFIECLKVEVDEPGLTLGTFAWKSSEKAVATLSVAPHVAAGDYWLKISCKGAPVLPQFGSIIQIKK